MYVTVVELLETIRIVAIVTSAPATRSTKLVQASLHHCLVIDEVSRRLCILGTFETFVACNVYKVANVTIIISKI